jgi:hypothetical protein
MLLPGLFVFVGERQRYSGFSEIVPTLRTQKPVLAPESLSPGGRFLRGRQ